MIGAHGLAWIQDSIKEAAGDVDLPSMRIIPCQGGTLGEMAIIADVVEPVGIPNQRDCLYQYLLQIGRLEM